MSLEIIIFLGILFNIAVFVFSKGFRSHTTGIDSLPAVSMIAGFTYGAQAGIIAAVIVSVVYYLVRMRRMHHAPLTIIVNVLVAFLASYLGFAGLFVAGILLLVIYHLLSGIVIGLLGAIKPEYFTFIVLNVVTTIMMLSAAAAYV